MTFKELENLVEEQGDKITTLEEKLEEKEDLTLPEKVEENTRLIKFHKHQGLETSLLYERIAVVSTAPSGIPSKRLTKQIYIYKSGGTKRLYIYDFTNAAWYYVALT